MKILLKGLTTRFLLAAALSASFASFSYGMDELAGPAEPKLPHEMLAAYNTYTIESAERACQEMAGHFLAKENTIKNKISALEIGKLETEYKSALSAVRLIANVDESFNLLDAVPEDATTFLTQVQEGQRKQGLLEIALLKKEIFEREAIEARELYNFFGNATNPLAFLFELKNLIITREMQLPEGFEEYDYHRNHHHYLWYCKDTTALAFIARVKRNALFLDTVQVKKSFLHVALQSELADIIRRVDGERDSVNQWFSDLPRVRETILSAVQQAQIQQSILTQKYQPAALSALKPAEVVSHRNELRAASEVTNEKVGILNVIKTFRGFVDDSLEYLKKNSKIT